LIGESKKVLCSITGNQKGDKILLHSTQEVHAQEMYRKTVMLLSFFII